MSKLAEAAQHQPGCLCGRCCITCASATHTVNLLGECPSCAGEPIDERELYGIFKDDELLSK
jgi:hypothetical protein